MIENKEKINCYLYLKKNYIGLDIFRLVLTIIVCAFHTTAHLGANYGIFQSVSKTGLIFMTAFFMLSGFSLFVNHSCDNISDIKLLKKFWIKRIIGIIPMYYIVSIIYIIFKFSNITIKQELFLAPIEGLCLQSNFSSLFEFTHNGGTWFISCIMMCYIIYPFLQETVKQINGKTKIVFIIVLYGILLYSSLVVQKFKLGSIYSNPFFRILEFSIGIILASLKLEIDNNKFVKKFVYNIFSIFIEFCLLIICITIADKTNFADRNYMFYSSLVNPIFMIILFGLSGVKCDVLSKSRILKYCSGISYTFFLSQLFSNEISKKIILKYSITSNVSIIILGWTTCIIIALILHEIFEKPIKKLSLNKV